MKRERNNLKYKTTNGYEHTVVIFGIPETKGILFSYRDVTKPGLWTCLPAKHVVEWECTPVGKTSDEHMAEIGNSGLLDEMYHGKK